MGGGLAVLHNIPLISNIVTTDPRHEYIDPFKTFSSKQNLQQALISWSNFSVDVSGKGEKHTEQL